MNATQVTFRRSAPYDPHSNGPYGAELLRNMALYAPVEVRTPNHQVVEKLLPIMVGYPEPFTRLIRNHTHTETTLLVPSPLYTGQ